MLGFSFLVSFSVLSLLLFSPLLLLLLPLPLGLLGRLEFGDALCLGLLKGSESFLLLPLLGKALGDELPLGRNLIMLGRNTSKTVKAKGDDKRR